MALTITQTQTGTVTHGDQMEDQSRSRTNKKNGWFTDPHGLIGGEVWHKMHELVSDEWSPECNEHESCQALCMAVLSIVARRAQSYVLAFEFYMFMHSLRDPLLTRTLPRVGPKSEYKVTAILICP